MNSFLRRTVPAALLAGGALMVATAGAAGAQVPVPGADGLPTGGVDSVSDAPAALCTGPLGAISGLSGVCDVAGEDQVQVGETSQVLPTADEAADEAQAQEQPQSAVNVDLQGDEEPEPEPCDGAEPGDCDVPDDEPCDECQPPTSETTMPPTSETTVTTVTTTAPPTTHVSAAPPAEELPRTGSTVAPFAIAGAALLALGAALVASKRYAVGRR
jgi:LPXTG-motif cell wall-anchored protein